MLSRIFAIIFVSGLISGCTIRPKIVEATQPSFDGNVQNSGILQLNSDGSAQITAHARDRYNALAAVYGAKFLPPIIQDAGLTPGPEMAGAKTWIIDAQHLVDWQTMNRWKRQAGRPQ